MAAAELEDVKRKDVENRDLIEAIDALLQGREVSFVWVPGHAGHELNEKADFLARNAARMADERVDLEYRRRQS